MYMFYDPGNELAIGILSTWISWDQKRVEKTYGLNQEEIYSKITSTNRR